VGTRSPDGPWQSQRRHKKVAARETGCKLQMGAGTRDVRSGIAVLGQDEVRFRTGRTGRHGRDFHLHIPYQDITALAVDAHAGLLTLTTREHGQLTLQLGRLAAEWKRLIEERPDRLGELGVRPGAQVLVLAALDAELETAIRARAAGDGDPLDVAFLGVAHRADLARVAELAARLRPDGGLLWLVIDEDGRHTPPEHDLAACAHAAGLTEAGTVRLARKQVARKLRRV